MKKRLTVLAALIITVMLVIFAINAINKKDDPLKQLKTNTIESVDVTVLPPIARFQIEEIEEFVDAINELKIIEKDDTHKGILTQNVCFEIVFQDGTKQSMNLIDNYIVIEDVGYKVNKDSCDKLRLIVYEYLKEYH